MGYDAHITRAEYWAENEDASIAFDEWIEAAQAESRIQDMGGGCFVANEVRADGGDAALFWDDGDVYTSDPDEATLGLMRDLARSLQATVQGDDGEHY